MFVSYSSWLVTLTVDLTPYNDQMSKFLRRCNPEEVWDNAHDVQESTSVSDSDSDADFHVVARNIPPDVLADSSSNGAPPSPPQYIPTPDSPLPYVPDVPDDILCQSDNDMDTSS